MKQASLFFAAMLTCFILDMIWLGVIAKTLYQGQLNTLLRKSGDVFMPNWGAAVMVYITIALGILCFVIPKAQGSLLMAMTWGAMFGFVTYGIYDFTNLAILANWPLSIALIDIVWGMVLCGTTSLFTAIIQRWIGA